MNHLGILSTETVWDMLYNHQELLDRESIDYMRMTYIKKMMIVIKVEQG